MSTRAWSARSRGVTAVGLVLLLLGLLWLVWWLLGKGNDGAGIANVLALPVAVLGTVAAVIGLWSRPRADDPVVLARRARTLLDQVVVDESRTLQRLLGDTGDPQPADVGFAQPEAAVVRWRTDGGADSGSLATIAAFYGNLRRGRLVVLGDPGAGKTVLIIRLLLDLAAESATVSDTYPVTGIRVPVRLSLAAFPGNENTNPEVTRERLDDWIVDHLTLVYSVERTMARMLVTSGWVLPILDGLDEMDNDADPVRARAVVAALNMPAGISQWPIVLTCRTTRYYQLVYPDGRQPGVALQDATTVTMEPLDVEQVVGWLAHRFPDKSQPDGIQSRWRPVAIRIRKHPAGRLAACLTNPLRLYLAVVVYHDYDSRPHQLCDLDTAALDEHLFNQLVPAVVAHYPRRDGGYYNASDVQRWLRTLADHLACMGTQDYSGIDLHLQEFWRTTGNSTRPGHRIRYQAATLISALISVPMVALSIYVSLTKGTFVPRTFGEWMIYWSISALLIPGVVAALCLYGSARPSSPPLGRLDPRIAVTSMWRRRLTRLLVVGIIAGFAFAFVLGLAAMIAGGLRDGLHFGVLGLSYGISIGLVFGVVLGLTVELTAFEQAARRPSDPMRQALIRDFVYGIAMGMMLGVGFGLSYGLLSGLMLGLSATFAFGLMSGPSPWPRYTLAVLSLSRRTDLPLRLGYFLDWAYTAGLVRLAGLATQFRHRDLQTRLTTSASRSEASMISRHKSLDLGTGGNR